MIRNFLILLYGVVVLMACHRSEDFFAQEVEAPIWTINPIDSVSFDNDEGLVNIHTVADANFMGLKNPTEFLDISGVNASYCHPDVLYFPNKFNGYRYWMVFTPYFGAVGTNQNSKKFENPSIVVSNDGLDWTNPPGLTNPIINAPYPKESFRENKVDPIQGFWSDVDWVFLNDRFYLYYRGSFITAQSLKSKCVLTNTNFDRLKLDAHRTIVQQTSTDGIRWSNLNIAFTSNPPFTPKNDHVLSPSFIHNGSQFLSYEIELNLNRRNFKGKEPSYVVRRTSTDGINFTGFKESKLVNFLNKPWLRESSANSPWHIQATFVDGYYFLCIAVGDVKKYTAELLYVAYSKDGINFKVFPKPLLKNNAYRSAIFPMGTSESLIKMGAMIGNKSGEFRYREFTLSKEKIKNSLVDCPN
ncbi:hypothetical protein BWD42_23490 [Sphingobacterium sp. CZ-UAM]|uniref:hypothetical protein n=1 Tax=unclassified Sphingobacterium TaxID=2609468 RepID=UPI0009849E28|nr:hypothetical protein [Sphingobacterium sp. CZ-UAM]OOG15847.1 hypothetical protein BWD42_23490 [Sphingobacterium sp. CZ-UAM]